MQYAWWPKQQGMMTLRAVLLLFTGSLIAAMLVVLMTISFDRFRNYIATQLEGHAQDAATAVGLSLSNAIDGRDPVASASLIDSVFDSGRYLSIEYRDYRDHLIAGRSATLDSLPVPGWFIRLASLPAPVGEAEVMHGWQRLGKVRVVSDPGPAYLDLWRTTRAALVSALLIGAVTLGLLLWLLTRSLRSLRAVERQANAIGHRDFRQRVPLASTRELNQVTRSMNQMADDLEQLFEGQAKLIQHLRRLNNEDALTGLTSRRAFDQRLKVEVESQETVAAGVLILVQLAGFADVNQQYGRDDADSLLKRLAGLVSQFVLDHAGGFAGRRTGAEFAVYLPGAALVDAIHWARRLVTDLDALYADAAMPLAVSVHAGVAPVAGSQSISTVFAAADEALRHAQASGGSGCRSADAALPNHHGADAWRHRITRALDNEWIQLWHQPLLQADGQAVVYRLVHSRIRVDDDWVRGGLFVPMAERFGLMARLDLMVVQQLIRWLTTDAGVRLAMTLGISSIADPTFRQALLAQLASASSVCGRLCIGIQEHAVHYHRPDVGELVAGLRRLNVAVMIDRFGVGGVPFSYLTNLPIQALRIDQSFVHDLPRHPDNQFYLESIAGVGHSRGVSVYVAGVETAAEWELVRQLGIDGASGYHLGRPVPVD